MSRQLDELFVHHLETLQLRLEAALAAGGLDGLVLYAGTAPRPDWDDQPYPFRVQPLFAQWCPQPAPEGAVLVLEPGRTPRLTLPAQHDFWHAPPEPPAAWWAEAFDVDYAASPAELGRRIEALGPRFGTIGEVAGDSNSSVGIVRRHLDYERAFKTPYEIECIARANRTAATGHGAVAALFADGRSELDFDFEYMRASRQRTGDLPYPNIVALNEHAAILHYQHLAAEPPPESLTLLVDAGARCNGYAADITRTHLGTTCPIGDLGAALDSMQQTLCTQAVAGIEFHALHDRAHQLLAGILTESGLVKTSADGAYTSGITRIFLPHGLGHLLGLQVHDAAGWQRAPLAPPTAPPDEHPSLRLTRRLEPGFVVTIEPGLYFIESLYAALDSKRRALIDAHLFHTLQPAGGIRIEDDVVVAAGQNSNLTREAFRELGLR